MWRQGWYLGIHESWYRIFIYLLSFGIQEIRSHWLSESLVFFILLQYYRFEISANIKVFINGGWGGSVGSLGKHVRHEGQNSFGWEGNRLRVQRRRSATQEKPTASADESDPQESPRSHPRWENHLWIPHHCRVYRWGLEEYWTSIDALWSLPASPC